MTRGIVKGRLLGRRPVLLAVTALALLAAAALLVRTPSFGLAGATDADAAAVSALRVERGDLVLTTAVEGTLRSVDSEQLGPPAIPYIWNYKISFMAPEGSTVRPGQPVLRFDASELERRLQETMAERDSAATQLEKAEVDLERKLRDMELQLAQAQARSRRAELKTDVPEGLQADKELAEARLDLAVAQAEVDSLEGRLALEGRAGRAEVAALREKRDRAEQRVAEMQEYMQRMNVVAAREGTVVYVSDWRGDKKKVGDDVWQSQKVLEIPDLGRMEAVGHVDEADAGRVAVGQPVSLRLDAHPDREFRGRVAEIARAVGRRDRGNPLKQVELVVALEETDTARMRPGMRFQGEIEVERAAGVLLAPAAAVRSTAEGAVAYRKGFFGAERVSPQVGRRNDELVEILGGLEEGQVLLPPEERVE